MSLHEDFSDRPLDGPPTPSIRRRLEDTIEALITQLDALDGDPDLEEVGDERDQSVLEWFASRRCYDPRRLDLLHEDAEEDDEGEDSHDAEAVNEDGGDVLDEPHDAEGEDD